ncbi:MAG: class I SAM-dependent methyltransferase [Candidatus Omnitrophota bacterium]|nr:class I SAM-dependent methyltransferase [Candidatus Omnitrophota bacterium]
MSDQAFAADVPRILSQEELCIHQDWFPGKEVLDAGCGNGRWTHGFLKLGARVTAVDYSDAALQHVRDSQSSLDMTSNLNLKKEDLLNISEDLRGKKFDLVFSWGVLHHTGDTHQALCNIAHLVKDNGVIYLYLYGTDSLSFVRKSLLHLLRSLLAPFPFPQKQKILERIFGRKNCHNFFDIYSPLINERFKFETIKTWLNRLGFPVVDQTIRHTEIFIRGCKEGCSAKPYFLPSPQRPYWFERLKP